MRMILLAASAMMLASCATPQMRAANMGAPQADAAIAEHEAPPPPQLRRPPSRGWPGYGYRSMPR